MRKTIKNFDLRIDKKREKYIVQKSRKGCKSLSAIDDINKKTVKSITHSKTSI